MLLWLYCIHTFLNIRYEQNNQIHTVEFHLPLYNFEDDSGNTNFEKLIPIWIFLNSQSNQLIMLKPFSGLSQVPHSSF